LCKGSNAVENDAKSALGHLNRGIGAFDDGDLEAARRQFAQALLQEPDNELAWLWLAEASETPGQKRYCYDRAVAIDPDSVGLFRRDALKAAASESEVPPVIRDLAKPPLPPSLRGHAGGPSLRKRLPGRKPAAPRPPSAGMARHLPPRIWLELFAIALVLAVGAWLIFLRPSSSDRAVLHLAVVAPLTGDSASVGETMRNAATMARDDINANLTDGPRVELEFFDDQDDPTRAAEIAQQIADDDRIAGVIGHSRNSSSLAAAPIYAAAGLPAISGQATIDSLGNYPDYFRTIFTNDDEAAMATHYLLHDLGEQRVSIISGTSDYEQSLADDFERRFGEQGTVANVWTIGEDSAASIAEIVAQMQTTEDMGALFLAVNEAHGYELLLQLRNAGLDPLILGSERIGTQAFARSFADLPQAEKDPNFYTRNLYVVSPLIYDSVGGDTLAFASRYRENFGYTPDWRAPNIWDAVMAFATAAGRAGIPVEDTPVAETRAQLITALHAMDSPETGFRGLSGTFFFTTHGNSPQGSSIGIFDDGRLISAPVQYRLIDYPDQYDIAAETAAGSVFEINGYYLRKYRVVYTGIQMIELRDLSSANQSFKADFYIFFRYFGDDAPLNIIFINAASDALSLGKPLSEEITPNGMNYRLFRVQGTFNETLDFSDYPWDEHQLTIRFQNPDLTQNDMVYVADPRLLAMSQKERLQSGFDYSRTFDRIPSWQVHSVQYEQESIASSSESYDTSEAVYYSEFRVSMDTGRDVNAFLSKNLLPLTLLTLVTYIAIWFPAEQAGARIGFAITALLSSSVMLNSVSTQLPAIGYNVAIEWGYYAYIGLSALLVLLTIAVDRSFKAKRRARTHRLDNYIRVMYPLAILAIVGLYWLVYRTSGRTAGGQDDIRLGVTVIMGALLALSALVVLWPDHFDWRSLRGYNDPDLTTTLEAPPAKEG
jgi:ABC-type branched-subunit amino acid transport system substrate-binding protein